MQNQIIAETDVILLRHRIRQLDEENVELEKEAAKLRAEAAQLRAEIEKEKQRAGEA